jgi:hypothetical protein
MRRNTFELTIKPNEAMMPGRLGDLLTIRTNESREPIVNCQITGNISGDLVVEPAVVAFGAVQAGANYAGQFTISHRKGAAFKVLSVDNRDQPRPGSLQGEKMAVNFEVVPNPGQGGASSFTIKCTGTAQQPRVIGPPMTGAILITTDAPGEGVKEVPYSLTVRPLRGKPAGAAPAAPVKPAQPADGAPK